MNTDPGSYTWVTAESDGASTTPAGRVSDWATRVAPDVSGVDPTSAVRVGADRAVEAPWPAVVESRLAMARMSPVFTSMITAVPDVGFEATISAARACSVTYCTDSSRVSSSPVPGWAGVDASVLGSVTPSGDSRTSVLPALPARSDWYWYSIPDVPAPFHPTVPTTGSASSPTGHDPLRLGHQVDAVQVHLGHLGGHRVGHPVGEVHEPAVLGQLGAEGGRRAGRGRAPGRRPPRPGP